MKGNFIDQTNKILPLEECLAKTSHDADGNIGPGVNVETHCLAAFEVARQLLKYYRHFCTASLWDLPKDLLAPLLHDVGKVSPRAFPTYAGEGELYCMWKCKE